LLPSLPSKTIPFIGIDSNGIQKRARELVALLTSLSRRPDIRQSQTFRTFLDYDSQTGLSTSPHELIRGRTTTDPRYGVVGISTIGDVMVSVHADTTALSRLGKVWSIIEPDQLGQFSLWRIARGTAVTQPSDKSDEANISSDVLRLGEQVFTRVLPELANSSALSLTTNIFVMGMGNGVLVVYDIESPLAPKYSIRAHGTSPVVAVGISENTIVSIGLDGALRLSSATTGLLVSGGKLSKRLESGEVFTCMHIHQETQRVFIGTNKGRVFIYDIATGTPQFLHALSMVSYPVHSITTSSNNELFVAFDAMVSVFEIPSTKGTEREGGMKRVQNFQVSKSGLQVHACLAIPKSTLTAFGLSDGSVVICNKTLPIYSRYFSEERINVLHYSQPDGVLWVGTDDGRISECIIPSSVIEDSEYVADCALEESSTVSTVSPMDPQPLRSTDRVPEVLSEAPLLVSQSSTSAVKSSALAEDSDDEDWKRGIFST